MGCVEEFLKATKKEAVNMSHICFSDLVGLSN